MNASSTLITVTFNSVAALSRHWQARPGQSQWIVVDNASTDESADLAESLGAQVIRLPRNVGFSAANNVGAALATAECLVFVNPDVTVDPDSLPTLTGEAVRRQAIVAPQLVNLDGSPQENGRRDPYLSRKVSHLFGTLASREHYEVRADRGQVLPVDWVMGAALAIPGGLFARLGGWDPSFFIYYEDADICLRAKELNIPTFLMGSARWAHGWERATRRGFSLRSWKYEAKSAAKFYRRYPRLLLPPPRRG